MTVRRAFYYALIGAVLVLPAWLLIGRGIVFGDSGWDFVLLLFVAPVLTVFLAIILGLTLARASVRRAKAVSWLDVGVLSAWWALLIIAGFVTHDAIAVLVIVAAIGVFWVQVWQLVTETRARFRRAVDRLRGDAPPADEPARPVTVIRIDP